MRNILRNLVLAPVVLAAAVVATNSAMAEVTVKVPFSFSAAGKQCPAGSYTVNRDLQHGLVTLRSKDYSRGFSWIVGPGDAANDSAVVLKFNEQGQAHSLRSIQFGQQTTSRLDSQNRNSERTPVQTLPGN